MLTLYGCEISGNSYKTKLTCELLDIDYNWIEIDLFASEHKQPEFLEINPLGQLPTLVISTDNEHCEPSILLESNAIMCYLARDSYLIPTDPIDHAKMLQWLFFEQAEIKTNIGAVRYIKRFQNMLSSRLAEYEQKFARSQYILSYLDQHLADNRFLIGDTVCLADISVYVYTQLAEEGGLELANYPNLQVWFERVEGLEGFIKM